MILVSKFVARLLTFTNDATIGIDHNAGVLVVARDGKPVETIELPDAADTFPDLLPEDDTRTEFEKMFDAFSVWELVENVGPARRLCYSLISDVENSFGTARIEICVEGSESSAMEVIQAATVMKAWLNGAPFERTGEFSAVFYDHLDGGALFKTTPEDWENTGHALGLKYLDVELADDVAAHVWLSFYLYGAPVEFPWLLDRLYTGGPNCAEPPEEEVSKPEATKPDDSKD